MVAAPNNDESEFEAAEAADQTVDLDAANGHKLWQLQKAAVPSQEQFEIDGEAVEFLKVDNKRISGLVDKLIDKHKLAARLVTVELLWKRRGGTTSGQDVWGKCLKLSGYSKYKADSVDFVIWLAADNLGTARVSNLQIEALIFHQLLHITEQEDSEGNSKAVLRAHDVDGFVAEIEEYGLWKDSLANAAPAFKQATLTGV